MKRGHSAIIGVVVVSLILMSAPLVAADSGAGSTLDDLAYTGKEIAL